MEYDREEDWILLDDHTNHDRHIESSSTSTTILIPSSPSNLTASRNRQSSGGMSSQTHHRDCKTHVDMDDIQYESLSSSSHGDPLTSNVILQSYNISDHEAVIHSITVPPSSYHHRKTLIRRNHNTASVSVMPANVNEDDTPTVQQQQQQQQPPVWEQGPMIPISKNEYSSLYSSPFFIKQKFLHHPIQLFPSLFIQYFFSCLWKYSSYTIQCGFVFIGIGIVFQIMGCVYAFMVYCTSFAIIIITTTRRRMILSLFVFLFLLLLRRGIISKIYTVSFYFTYYLNYIQQSCWNIWLQSYSITLLTQRVVLLSMCTWIGLQMYTMTFLAWMITEHVQGIPFFSCFILSFIQGGILYLRHFYIYPLSSHVSIQQQEQHVEKEKGEKKTYIPFLYFRSLGLQVDMKVTSSTTTTTRRTCISWTWIRDAWILLYITALWIVWISPTSTTSTKYTLMGPFLISLGCFLLTQSSIDTIPSSKRNVKEEEEEDDENDIGAEKKEYELDSLTRILRLTLQWTLRDMIISMGENVAQDEMLQIALLRWIIDYGSRRNTTTTTTCNTCSSSTTTSQSKHSQENVPSTHSISNTLNLVDSKVLHTIQNTDSVDAISDDDDHHHSSSVDSSLFRSDNHSISWEDLSSMLSLTLQNIQKDMTMAQKDAPKKIQSNTPCTIRLQYTSLSNLQHMLDTWNVDEHAKPAVLAYKQAVKDFPPKKNISIVISIVRRCPATIVILYLLSIGSRHVFILAIALFPMMCVEMARIQLWIQSCWLYSESSTTSLSSLRAIRSLNTPCYVLPEEKLDSMYILLSGDQDVSLNYIPPLLYVWRNILLSVDALESGLVAARYVHTAHVASKLAGNVISITEFARQVKDKGWLHGVGTMATEMIRDHTSDTKYSHPSGGTVDKKVATGTQYSRAVVDLIKNGQILSKNIIHIWDDHKKRNKGSSRGDNDSNYELQKERGTHNDTEVSVKHDDEKGLVSAGSVDDPDFYRES